MRFRSIKYYFEEAFKSIARNSLMSVTSVATVASCILIVIFSYCIAVNIDFILKQFETSIGISAILDDSLTFEEVSALREEILTMPHVATVEFISADQALDNFAKTLGDNNGIIAGFEDDNPLRRSFTITLDNSKSQDDVITALEGMQNKGVATVRHARSATNILVSINSVVRIVSIIIILILGVLAIIIIMNTIKLTVNNRRNEILIMKYVGATDWFIKWPFVIEGVMIGLLGAAVPLAVCWLGYGKVIETIIGSFTFVNTMFTFKTGFEIFPIFAPVILALGALIGTIGSLSSMRKYLNV